MRMWNAMTLIAPLAVALTVAPVPARAQRREGPCRNDVEKFCQGIQPGGGRYRDCLRQHAAELSPACKERVSQVKAKAAAWRQACQADVQKLCGDVAPGRGSVLKCLRQHQEDLSQACKDQLTEHPHRRRTPVAAPGQ